jgi:hypothetical protein
VVPHAAGDLMTYLSPVRRSFRRVAIRESQEAHDGDGQLFWDQYPHTAWANQYPHTAWWRSCLAFEL